MKLLRASCPCGYHTRKARCGYGDQEWWFPLFHCQTGALTDIYCVLNGEAKARSAELWTKIWFAKDAEKGEVSAKIERLTQNIFESFIADESRKLAEEYATKAPDFVFDPAVGTMFTCPQCHKAALLLEQVLVMAKCERGCEHIYPWLDSNTSGCPICGHFPRDYKTDTEARFASLPRVICQCCSITDSISHLDGYCPACGNAPEAYSTQDVECCGKHHERLISYQITAGFLFMEPVYLCEKQRFPRAKFFPDKSPEEEGYPGAYCPTCEAEYKGWLQEMRAMNCHESEPET